jgi:hypothetical protein
MLLIVMPEKLSLKKQRETTRAHLVQFGGNGESQ